jgi:hypothetical protein
MKLHFTKQYDMEIQRKKVGSRVDRTLGKHTASSLSAGDFRLRSLRRMLDNLGIVRSVDQILFHERFTQACLPHIYGNDWSGSCVRVMKELLLKEIRYVKKHSF